MQASMTWGTWRRDEQDALELWRRQREVEIAAESRDARLEAERVRARRAEFRLRDKVAVRRLMRTTLLRLARAVNREGRDVRMSFNLEK